MKLRILVPISAFSYTKLTVLPLLEAAASNFFDEILAQNLLGKNCVLLRLLFKGGFYLRAASNKGNTVYETKLHVGMNEKSK